MIFDNQEEKDKYLSWLKSLKAGDFVIVNEKTVTRKCLYSIKIIKSITPTGRILIEFKNNNKIYFEKGISRGYSNKILEEYTEEKARELVLIPNATYYLNKIEWDQLREKDPEMLLEIYEKVKARLVKE